MTIYDILKEDGARLLYQDKCLVFNGINWVVYERKPYAKKSVILYEGQEESRAIWYLMSEICEIKKVRK